MELANCHENRYQTIADVIGGIILLGTPHRGSPAQPIGSIIARAAEALGYGESTLMMDVKEDSKEIHDLVNKFTKIVIRNRIAETGAIVCFFENQKTDYSRRAGNLVSCELKVLIWTESLPFSVNKIQVVDEISATIPGLDALSLDSDHIKLNKFARAEEQNYRLVSSNIHRIAAASSKLIEDRSRCMLNSTDNLCTMLTRFKTGLLCKITKVFFPVSSTNY